MQAQSNNDQHDDGKQAKTPQKMLNQILRETTEDYIAVIPSGTIPDPTQIEKDILTNEAIAIRDENKNRQTGNRLRTPSTLVPAQIADLLAALYPICTICTGGADTDREYDLLAIYEEDGPDAGTYVTDESVFRNLMRQYNYTLTDREFKETMTVLRTRVERKFRCEEKNLIAVNNGIFDYDTKTLMPFTADKIFLSKSHVNYIPNAVNPVIHNNDDDTDWDVESWMSELSDDPDIVNLLWEIIGAVIRPLVSWNKSAWLYSTTGNNGKGTLCELMRRLCGQGSYAAIPLSALGQDFMLEPLTRASCIIVDENDVGTFIDKAANLKAIITNDVIQINRKFRSPVAYRFRGFMVQCLNEMPRIKDRSDSFFRRQLFIPFDKCFTGHERKYIKNDYLQRQDVLEYVLCRVLNMDYYTLSEPEACRLALEEYKEFNNPLKQFAEDFLPEASWDFLPFPLLYQAYVSWSKKNMPSGTPQNRNTFINDFLTLLPDYPQWTCPGKSRQVRMGSMMDGTELLLDEYGLTEWMNPAYARDPHATSERRCTPVAGQYSAKRYRGICRVREDETMPELFSEDDEEIKS